ncbi:hypothetical protein [Maridesulfovibrio hydrothermalis]|uniref:Uncharacterized protein n=1 Tax=Maridesulfovibrio hydrothermalis AM13 = DSM 14728 TaxID=1121451 RepID=L0RE10_9BACT|nr:hypothetical protein [Maridesulfovibrio hydrothermalis]CCO24989.1 conserved exported protein of unknown function [Maridesulfovibrio hydrothermalis AM13 = DSM 14728]
MRYFLFLTALILLIASPVIAAEKKPELSTPFGELSEVEGALKTLSKNIEKVSGSDTRPDRIYALQDMAAMCKTSKMQVHSLNSLFSVVKLVKREKNFQSKEAVLLKKKSSYAFNDFNRRKAFITNIIINAKDQKLRDLAHIFNAQLSIILKQLTAINKQLK